MSTRSIEALVSAAFADARLTVEPSRDLFTRVQNSLADARARRRWRRAVAAWAASGIGAFALLAIALSDITKGQHGKRRFTMDWWVIELLTNIVLVVIAIGLGPFIKRFGRAYAADVFRANPRTGKSYLVLTDVAYYLIFTSFILFTVTFVPSDGWRASTGEQLKEEVARIGGILLIMGLLHSANVIALPVIGRLLSLNKRLDDDDGGQRGATAGRSSTPARPGTADSLPPLSPGTWILRVEKAPNDI